MIKDFGTLSQGSAFELLFKDIPKPDSDPVEYFTDLSSFDFEFTTKGSKDDTDEEAVAHVKDGDSEISTDEGTLRVQVVSDTISAGLTVGKTYFFDAWMKETGQPWRAFNLETNKAYPPCEVGKFRVTKPINQTKET